MGLTMVDIASPSSTMLFAPFTVCEAFSSLSKAVHSAMKYLERSPNYPGMKHDVLIKNTIPQILLQCHNLNICL